MDEEEFKFEWDEEEFKLIWDKRLGNGYCIEEDLGNMEF